jgi:hypothetical protein
MKTPSYKGFQLKGFQIRKVLTTRRLVICANGSYLGTFSFNPDYFNTHRLKVSGRDAFVICYKILPN